MDVNQLLQVARRAAAAADAEIMSVYQASDFQVQLKADESPLTLADKKSHQAITKILAQTGIPILSEESQAESYEVRRDWKYLWLVDPLDGTKEFIKRNGEFTVNIALIANQTPVIGVVSVPVTGAVYYAIKDRGAYFKGGDIVTQLPKRKTVDLNQKGLRVVVSRSHMSEETQQFILQLRTPELVSIGSSLKFMLLASGKADVYPRFAPTMEWDTAAAHAIVNEVGMAVLKKDHATELVYNKPDPLNPFFLCR